MLCPTTGRNNFYGQEEKKLEFSGGDICGRCGKEQVTGDCLVEVITWLEGKDLRVGFQRTEGGCPVCLVLHKYMF